MTEHQLFLFLVEVAVLVVAARLGGELALRLGIAQVVGELVVGILLGPSLFGKLWPGGFRALFPADAVQHSLLEVASWTGVVFLVLLSGFETRLALLKDSGRAVVTSFVAGSVLPFVLGFGLGMLIPESLVGHVVGRGAFALFLGTAMSISAIPVIARILMDLDLMQSRVGVVIISTAVAEDTVGWIVLAIVAGLAAGNTIDGGNLVIALVGTGAFLLVAIVAGPRLVRTVLRGSQKLRVPYAPVTAVLALVFIGGAITEAIHVHLVLGCFVMGLLIAHSATRRDSPTIESIRSVGMAFFVPFFFAYTGIKVDLTSLRGVALPVAGAAVFLACAGKLIGGTVGARLGGLPRWEALAVGGALNARGAMELVIAAIGLSLGILTLPMYTTIVLIAVITSLMAAPMLRYFIRRHERTVPKLVPREKKEVVA